MEAWEAPEAALEPWGPGGPGGREALGALEAPVPMETLGAPRALEAFDARGPWPLLAAG